MQKRELKFRYVLERNEELMLFDLSLIDCEIESTNFRQFRQLTVFDGWSIIDVLQYIGLRRDKGGTEICEGDILKDTRGRILLVEWYKYGFSFKALTETNFLRARDIAQWFEDLDPFPEIIGNIYKNPELVKRVKPEK